MDKTRRSMDKYAEKTVRKYLLGGGGGGGSVHTRALVICGRGVYDKYSSYLKQSSHILYGETAV